MGDEEVHCGYGYQAANLIVEGFVDPSCFSWLVTSVYVGRAISVFFGFSCVCSSSFAGGNAGRVAVETVFGFLSSFF